MTGGPGRLVSVDPDRLGQWLAGFAERHGGASLTDEPGPTGVGTVAVGGDGAVARCRPFEFDPLGIVLLRRGGYAVGLAAAGRLTAHKTGTRYVQSRTAAGGWSQHRFARRRSNQADALAGSVVERAQSMLGARAPHALVVGGDKALVRQVLQEPHLATLAALPRRELYDIPDPRLVVMHKALARGRAVRVDITETTPGAGPLAISAR